MTEAAAADVAGSTMEGQEGSSSDPATTDSPSSPTTNPEKFKVKVDGQEIEVDIEELKQGYSHGKAANDRLREAAEMRKQAKVLEESLEAVKQGDYKSLVKLLGKDEARKVAEELLLDEINYNQLSDEEKAFIERQQELEEREKKLKEFEEQQEQAKRQELQTKALQDIDQEIGEVLKSLGRKPNPKLVAMIAQEMLEDLEYRQGNVPLESRKLMKAQDAVKGVEKRVTSNIGDYITSLTPEQAREKFPDLAEHFRKAEVAAIKSQGLKPGQAAAEPKKRKAKKAKRMTIDEWYAKKDRSFGG